jgi:hypothetical protein
MSPDNQSLIIAYWFLLQRVEQNAMLSGDVFDKAQVEDNYYMWNNITGDHKLPEWLRK